MGSRWRRQVSVLWLSSLGSLARMSGVPVVLSRSGRRPVGSRHEVAAQARFVMHAQNVQTCAHHRELMPLDPLGREVPYTPSRAC